MTNPDYQTLPEFHKRYVQLVEGLDVLEALRVSDKDTLQLVRAISEEKGLHRYAPGKWTIKELLCHMMDTERILSYRALRFSRNDKTSLHGFEENEYVPEANSHSRSIVVIADEMHRLRLTTIDLFSNLTTVMLDRSGKANNLELSVVNLGYIIAGHEYHHLKILRERYLL